VKNMSFMFSRATLFNQDISEWETGGVENMRGVFSVASSFDHSLGEWDVTGVIIRGMEDMLGGSGLSMANYDATLIGWAAQDVQRYVSLGAYGLTYCAGAEARASLVSDHYWDIHEDAPGCPPITPDAPDNFITEWRVTDGQITIPTNVAEHTYLYNIYWANSDGSVTGSMENVTRDGVISGLAPGTYHVQIDGRFPAIYFNNAGDKDEIVDVAQWGTVAWASMEDAFHGASNLQVSATDRPDLSGVTSLKSMFRRTTSFNSPIGHWDVSNVTIMDEIGRAHV